MPDGKAIEAVTLQNERGVTVRVITYGARIQEVVTPDRNGHPANIALGFSTLEGYLSQSGPYFDATFGGFAAGAPVVKPPRTSYAARHRRCGLQN